MIDGEARMMRGSLTVGVFQLVRLFLDLVVMRAEALIAIMSIR